MKKKGFLRQIILFVGILLFTSIVTSCSGGCKNNYLNGDTCGKAEVNGTNPFSKMRE